jgi:23S rRNA (pseudouridine1915-N3)-methyltransferase
VHIRLLAVGDRQPGWVDEAFNTYTSRFPREWGFRMDTISTAKRAKNEPAKRAVEAEGELLLAKLAPDEQLVLLDERGKHLNSKLLADRLSDWQLDGRNLSFIIGGPDGVSPACRERADFTWSLSDLTLPHGLARVLLAESLYRAWSLQAGHPYHRA